MDNSQVPHIPAEASSIALQSDLLNLFITVVTVIFSAGIFLAIIFFAVRYRRGTKVDRSNPPTHNTLVEIAWTAIPLGILMVMFVWGAALFLNLRSVPKGATEIYVVGKQWMWKIQHPEGRWEMNELHVPLGRPIMLNMTSEDVIHSFFIPEFRVKQDVIPGSYTRLWFTATQVGTYHLFCAEFCGTLHSGMVGTVTVMEPAEYQTWLATGKTSGTLAAEGERLFTSFGCNGCHGPNSSVRAPRLEGMFGKPVAIQIPQPGVPLERIEATTIIADDRYVHDSILLPEKEVAAGFAPIMPTFKNQITEEQILMITAYLKSLSKPADVSGTEQPQERLSPTEYEARTGFKPPNINNMPGGSSGGPVVPDRTRQRSGATQ